MYMNICGEKTFISTGGLDFDPKGEVLLFIHGSGQSHLSWMLQNRFFANRGYQVLTPDLPGHNLSEGEAIGTVEDQADWCVELLKAMGVSSAIVIGHSQGGLIALEMARRFPEMVKKMAIVASAMAIPVNDALLGLAKDIEPKAAKAMVSWSHGADGHKYDHTMPGHNHLNYGRELMAQNNNGVLLTDLNSCNNYQDGEAAAAAITCPTLCVLAEKDKMVPAKFGKVLAGQLADNTLAVVKGAGHFVHAEKSFETNDHLRVFFG